MSIYIQRDEPEESPDEQPDRWGFYQPKGGTAGEKCYHCESPGVAVLVEARGESQTSLTLLCASHQVEYQQLYRTIVPEGEMSAMEATRLAE